MDDKVKYTKAGIEERLKEIEDMQRRIKNMAEGLGQTIKKLKEDIREGDFSET